MMVFISNRKLHVSAYSDHHKVLTSFLAIRVIYKMHKTACLDVEISSSRPAVYAYYI